MKKYIPVLLALAALPSCVGIIYDSTEKDYKPKKVSLSDYSGTYKDKAIYSTPPSKILGLHGSKSMGTLLTHHSTTDRIHVNLTASNDLIVKFQPKGQEPDTLLYENGKDFKFVDHSIHFSTNREFGTGDSPMIAYVSEKMKWLIDENHNLVIIKTGGGAGLITVFPMALWAKTIAVFEKVK